MGRGEERSHAVDKDPHRALGMRVQGGRATKRSGKRSDAAGGDPRMRGAEMMSDTGTDTERRKTLGEDSEEQEEACRRGAREGKGERREGAHRRGRAQDEGSQTGQDKGKGGEREQGREGAGQEKRRRGRRNSRVGDGGRATRE